MANDPFHVTQRASQLLSGINVKLRGSDAPSPSPPGVQTAIQAATEVYNFFTVVGGTQLLYSANGWVRLHLRLEDAGPVAVGTRQSLTPVLSGAGQLLPTGQTVEFVLPKGTRLYYAAEAINGIAISIEPIPWGEIIALNVAGIFQTLLGRR